MGQSIPPDELDLLMAGYVLHDLSEEEALQLAEVLRQGEGQAAIQEMQALLEAAYFSAERTPPPYLRQRLMDAAQAAIAPSPLSTSRLPNQLPSEHPLPRWVSVAGALAAAVIVALSVSNYLLWRSHRVLARESLRLQQAQQEALTLVLQPTELSNGQSATVQVNIDPSNLRGTLSIENLPPLAPGQVYVLWTVLDPNAPFTTDDKNAILTHVFTVDAATARNESVIFPQAVQDLDVVQAIAITIEDANSPQRHESAPILIQQL